MHLEPAAVAAREQIEAGQPEQARRTMFAFANAEAAERFDAAAGSPAATYRDLVAALGPDFEGGYFLYRFSDPTFVVADAVVRSVGSVVLGGGGRAIDVCGGSGHLTRSLAAASTTTPVLADLYFSKLWLATRFTSPGCHVVCCDGNAPLPFAKDLFALVVCSDAFHYIWTKRLLASEMMRIATGDGAVAVTHAHNATQWNPSAGMPLPADAYRDLFADMGARVFSELALLDDVAGRNVVDLGRVDSRETLDADPALTIVASPRAGVFARRDLPGQAARRGELRINPLYRIDRDGGVRLTLEFPSRDYEEEYGAVRRYLPDTAELDPADAAALERGELTGGAIELARRRVILDLPKRYV